MHSQSDWLFEMACVCVTDSDSHNFRVDLIALISLSFYATKVAIHKLFQVFISQQGNSCKTYLINNTELMNEMKHSNLLFWGL